MLSDNLNLYKMKKLISLILLAMITSGMVYAQGSLADALKEIKSKGTYDTLVYYGVDFSRVRINDAPKISKNEVYSKTYPPAWIQYVEKELSPELYVRNVLGYKNFLYRQGDIFEKSVAVNPRLITGSDNAIPADTLKAMVEKYKVHAKSGLGLVLIPETFSKPQETAYTWVVFFDIKSRMILYKAKTFGKCSHMGYTAHWTSGVVEGFRQFASH